jgi:hypothetical protein
MPMTLGPALADTPRHCFHASIDDRRILIELDNGAFFKLVGNAAGRPRTDIPEQKQPLIAAAAQRLVEKGHFTERDGALEVVVTALDL